MLNGGRIITEVGFQRPVVDRAGLARATFGSDGLELNYDSGVHALPIDLYDRGGNVASIQEVIHHSLDDGHIGEVSHKDSLSEQRRQVAAVG